MYKTVRDATIMCATASPLVPYRPTFFKVVHAARKYLLLLLIAAYREVRSLNFEYKPSPHADHSGRAV
jgi:hypothetical protein